MKGKLNHLMGKRPEGRAPLAAALLLFLTATISLRAQSGSLSEEPHWLTVNMNQAFTGVYAEASQEEAKFAGNPTVTQTRVFVGPLVGLDMSGSVYHPNLMTFHTIVDGSAGWMYQNFTGPNARTENSLGYLGSFTGNAQLFDHKPLNGELFASYAHTYQDYDFFNRVYMDTWRYGGGLRYGEGPWLFSTRVWEESQDATSSGTPTKTERTVATFDATHNRDHGATSFNYTFSDYTANDYGTLGYGQDHTLGLMDTETFGSRDQIHSTVNLSYNHLDNFSEPTDIYNAMGNLYVDHSDTLKSIYNLNYQRENFGSDKDDTLTGSAALQHKLYDSLTSEIGVQGYRTTASSGEASQDSWQFGGGPAFNYTKKLGDGARLTAFESLLLLHTDVESTGGIIPVIDEAHTFGTGAHAPPDTFFLLQPQVITSTIVITDTQHLPPQGFIPGLDYQVINNGQMTLIRRLAGSRMPNAVLVSYSFASSPSGSYDTLNNGSGIRFDFFDNLFGVYTRYNLIRNYGAENLLVQNLDDVVFGGDVTWRCLRGGAEYEVYDSNLSSFKAWRFFEALTVQPDEYSSFSLNLNQTFTHYDQSGVNEESYSFIARYSRALTRHVGLTLEGGFTELRGDTVGQTLAVFRPMLQYTYGKFSASIGYDYGYDEYLGTDRRIRNMGFLRISRRF